MGPWVILLFLATPVVLTARLVALLADPEASWTRSSYLWVTRWVKSLRSFDPDLPLGRPIEDIAFDVRRLGRQVRHPDDGRSAARVAALLRSYDAVLGEACTALGYADLLGVLPPGPELDTERERVERLLTRAGVVLEQAG
jgi:hypothetical protein